MKYEHLVSILLTPFGRYIDDCRKSEKEPSLFQLLRFLHDVGAPLALPIPIAFIPAFVGRSISRTFCFVGGVIIGEWLLGYKVNYNEYYKKEAD
jgi:hypothetical protein